MRPEDHPGCVQNQSCHCRELRYRIAVENQRLLSGGTIDMAVRALEKAGYHGDSS